MQTLPIRKCKFGTFLQHLPTGFVIQTFSHIQSVGKLNNFSENAVSV